MIYLPYYTFSFALCSSIKLKTISHIKIIIYTFKWTTNVDVSNVDNPVILLAFVKTITMVKIRRKLEIGKVSIFVKMNIRVIRVSRLSLSAIDVIVPAIWHATVVKLYRKWFNAIVVMVLVILHVIVQQIRNVLDVIMRRILHGVANRNHSYQEDALQHQTQAKAILRPHR